MLFSGCGGRGLFLKKALGVEEPTPGSELPHRLRLRPVAMSGGAAARRSSTGAATENAAVGESKAAPQAGQHQRVALGNITNLVICGSGKHGAADSAPDAKFSSTKPLADAKKGGSFANLHNVNTEQDSVRKATSGQFDRVVSHHDIALQEENVFLSSMPSIVTAGGNSPGASEDSAPIEDAMSTFASTEALILSVMMMGTPQWQLLCIVGPMINFISPIVRMLRVCSLAKMG